MTNRPFVIDPVLTAIAVGYANPDMSRIADAVLPVQPVGSELFKWMEYPIGEAFQTPDNRIGRKGRPKQLEFGGTERESSVEDFGLDSPIPYSDIQAAAEARQRRVSSFDPEKTAVMMLKETNLNLREIRVATMVQDAANYDSGRVEVLSGGDQFNDYVNSDPIKVIQDALNSTFIYRPNMIVMSRAEWTVISRHPVVVNAIRGNLTNKGIVTPEEFVSIFAGEGLKSIQIGDAYYNSAKPGQPETMVRAWGGSIALLHINGQATPQGGTMTWGLTAKLGGDVAGRIEDPNIGLQGGFHIRQGERCKELVIAKSVGFLIRNVLGG